MAQYSWTDIVSSTETGAQLASRLNDFEEAIQSANSGSAAPTSPNDGQLWLDTSGGSSAYVLKIYGGATAGWVSLLTLDFSATSDQVTKEHGPPHLLDEDVQTTGVASLTVTTNAAANYDILKLELKSIKGVTSAATLRLRATTNQGSTWTAFSGGTRNYVLGTTHDTTSPMSSSYLIMATANGVQTITGEFLTTYGGSGAANITTGRLGATGTSVGGGVLTAVTGAVGQVNGFRVTASSGNVTGTLRLWGMPNT